MRNQLVLLLSWHIPEFFFTLTCTELCHQTCFHIWDSQITLDIDLLGRVCVQLSPFLVLRSWHCWLAGWASSAPALASTQKSLDACLDKRKLSLLVLTQDAKTVAPGASWDYQICAEQLEFVLQPRESKHSFDYRSLFRDVQSYLKNSLFTRKKPPPWVRGWCHPTQCLHWLSPSAVSALFPCSVFAERLKTASFRSGELIQKLGVVFLFSFWGFKKLNVLPKQRLQIPVSDTPVLAFLCSPPLVNGWRSACSLGDHRLLVCVIL